MASMRRGDSGDGGGNNDNEGGGNEDGNGGNPTAATRRQQRDGSDATLACRLGLSPLHITK